MTGERTWNTGERPRLYKIRRLAIVDGKEVYHWLAYRIGIAIEWVPDQIDGYAFTDYKKAQALCETVKSGKLRHPRAIYHSVVPV